jgi:ribonuclease VapC
MIIDTSALVAVLDQEPEAERIVRTLASAKAATVGCESGPSGNRNTSSDLDLVLAKLRVDIAAVTANQADLARKVFRPYGGRG